MKDDVDERVALVAGRCHRESPGACTGSGVVDKNHNAVSGGRWQAAYRSKYFSFVGREGAAGAATKGGRKVKNIRSGSGSLG